MCIPRRLPSAFTKITQNNIDNISITVLIVTLVLLASCVLHSDCITCLPICLLEKYCSFLSRCLSAHKILLKVNKNAMIRNGYNHIPPPTLNTKRERRTHTKFEEGPRGTRTVYRMHSSFPNRWSFSYHNCKQQQHIFLPIFCFKLQKQTKTGSLMGNCYTVDHIAKDHIHTDITCNIE